MTKYDCIKNMSIEKMSKFLSEIISCATCPAVNNCHRFVEIGGLTVCSRGMLKWLESEAEE